MLYHTYLQTYTSVGTYNNCGLRGCHCKERWFYYVVKLEDVLLRANHVRLYAVSNYYILSTRICVVMFYSSDDHKPITCGSYTTQKNMVHSQLAHTR